MPLPALACSAALCAMLPPRCALRCLHEARRPRLPGQGRSSRGGRVRVTSEALEQGRPPIGGAESEPPGPAFDSGARTPFVGGGGCAWVQCPCGGSGHHTGRWVLGWRLRRVVWLSAALIVVYCFALFCCTVCCVLSCAGKFRYVSLPALRCCAVLPPLGVAAAATRVGPLFPSGPSPGNLRSAWTGPPTHWRGRIRASGACQRGLCTDLLCAPPSAPCAWASCCPTFF